MCVHVIYKAISAIRGARFSQMQWSAWARPALRLSDVPWECQMWGHPSTPLRPDPSPNVLSLAQLTLASSAAPHDPARRRTLRGEDTQGEKDEIY